MPPRKHPEPNRLDPLSESAINRRVWAAYLHAGFTRTTFAHAMGVRYHQVSNWDTGRFVMSLAHFMRAADLVGYSMDQLAHGHAASGKARQPEGPLSQDAIRTVLLAINATGEQIAALGEHLDSPSGRLQPMTRAYVVSFVTAYSAAVKGGRTHAQALKAAMIEAVNARAAVSAIDAGRMPFAAHDGESPKPKPKRRAAARVHVARPDRPANSN